MKFLFACLLFISASASFAQTADFATIVNRYDTKLTISPVAYKGLPVTDLSAAAVCRLADFDVVLESETSNANGDYYQLTLDNNLVSFSKRGMGLGIGVLKSVTCAKTRDR